MDWKNILSRSAWTFAQAFIAALAVAQIANLDDLKSAAIAAGLAGLAATLSFVKTVVVEQVTS